MKLHGASENATAPDWRRWKSPPGGAGHTFGASEIGALFHLYCGEVYCSTIWRTRLYATSNWSVVTLGLALSISYASPDASPLPLLLVGLLILMFLMIEARRYRYFNVRRALSLDRNKFLRAAAASLWQALARRMTGCSGSGLSDAAISYQLLASARPPDPPQLRIDLRVTRARLRRQDHGPSDSG